MARSERARPGSNPGSPANSFLFSVRYYGHVAEWLCGSLQHCVDARSIRVVASTLVIFVKVCLGSSVGKSARLWNGRSPVRRWPQVPFFELMSARSALWAENAAFSEGVSRSCGRAAEGGGLLNRYRGNPIMGSNPIGSAILFEDSSYRSRPVRGPLDRSLISGGKDAALRFCRRASGLRPTKDSPSEDF